MSLVTSLRRNCCHLKSKSWSVHTSTCKCYCKRQCRPIGIIASTRHKYRQQFTTVDVSVEGFSEHIDVNVASSSSITLLPGENRTVEINILANPFSADANHSARVTLSNDGNLVAQTLVQINVNPFHNITFGFDENVSVVPGQNFSMVFDVTNNGNLVEFVEFDFGITGGSDEWIYEIEPENSTFELAGIETKASRCQFKSLLRAAMIT